MSQSYQPKARDEKRGKPATPKRAKLPRHARKAEGTVRPEHCCVRKIGTCSKHSPNVAVEVRLHGKWVHLGVLTPEHEWVAPPPSKSTLRKLSLIIEDAGEPVPDAPNAKEARAA